MQDKNKLRLWPVVSGSGLLMFLLLALFIGFGLMLEPDLKMIIVGLLGILAIVVIQWLSGLHQRILRLEQQQQLGSTAPDLSLQKIILYASVLVGLLGYVQQHIAWSVAAILGFGLCLIQVLYQLHIRVSRLEENNILVAARTAATQQASEQPQPFTAAKEPALDWMQRSQVQEQSSVVLSQETDSPSPQVTAPVQAAAAEPAWWQPFGGWMLHGNPILRMAIAVLMVGVILLLRFASEHWQLSLAIRLLFIALAGGAVTGLGYYLARRNALFAVSLQGLGLAVLFLTLVFAHHYAVVADLTFAGFLFALLLLLTTFLSLKQQSLYLAILALGMAYLAPLLIPQTHPDALFLLSYYLLINIAVAIVNFIQPWRILNHIAFFASMLIGGVIMGIFVQKSQKVWLDLILWCHIGLFIWLSVRYSQLMSDLQQKLTRWQPALDVSLIFSVPVIGFSLHAFLMHASSWAMTSGAAGLAVVYAALTLWIRLKQPSLSLLGKSFFILAVAFTALIFPLAQGAHWSAIGWVVQGTALVVWESSERDRLSLYGGVLLLLLSSVTLFYQVWNEPEFPLLSMTIYALCHLVSVFSVLLKKNAHSLFGIQDGLSCILLALGLYAGAVAGVELFDWQGQGFSPYLLIALLIFAVFYAVMQFKAQVEWQLPQLWIHSLLLLFFVSEVIGQQIWQHFAWDHRFAQISFLLAASLNSVLLVRRSPELKQPGIRFFEASVLWGSLAMMGLAILPQNPVIALSLVPLIYALAMWKSHQIHRLQQPAYLLWTGVWLIWANLSPHAASSGYVLPLLNLTDLMTLSMLAGALILIYRQQFLDSVREWGIKLSAIMLSLFVFSSVLLRALHHYLATPLWSRALWLNATVQFSLTLLWVVLAFILMTLSSRRAIRQVWFVGAALLGLVVLKLVVLDLAQSATLTRVFSFIGAGAIMLLIAYLAPLPPASREPKV